MTELRMDWLLGSFLCVHTLGHLAQIVNEEPHLFVPRVLIGCTQD